MRLIRLFFFLVSSFLSASSVDFPPVKGEVSVISSDQVFKGRYVELGETIEVSGVVQGDAYLVGTQVTVDGEIEGDLFAVGFVVSITGKVKGNVRILAAQAFVDGEISGNTAVFGVSVHLPKTGTLLGDLFLLAGYGDLENKVEGNVLALVGGLKLSGLIKKNLQTFVGRLRLMGSADIEGNLKYRSSYSAVIDPGATVKGEIIYKSSLVRDLMDMPILSGVAIGSKVAGFLMNFLYTFVVGIIFIRFFPRKLRNALLALRKTPWKCGLVGCLTVIFLPILSFVLLITIIGTPFALTLMALNIVGFYTVKIFSILWMSNALFHLLGWEKNKIHTLFAGQVLYYSLCYIPVVGWFISLFAMLFGLGSSILAQLKKES